MHKGPPVAALPRRERLVIGGFVLLLTGLAWAYLLRLDGQMSASMEHHVMMAAMGMESPWTIADVSLTFAMWVVMMVGMMAGAAAPVLLLFAGARRARGDRSASPAALAFGSGYALVWAGFSALATLAQWALHDAALLSSSMAASSPRLGGAILVIAGVYQLTPFKGACLAHCRSPLGFLMTHWRDGMTGALTMGARHGLFCLGCCWALMCVLFVVGVMNLAWVAALAVFVLIEKTGPSGARLARVAGMALIAIGALRAAEMI